MPVITAYFCMNVLHISRTHSYKDLNGIIVRVRYR